MLEERDSQIVSLKKALKKLAKELEASKAVAAKSEVFVNHALKTNEKLEEVRFDYQTLLDHFVRLGGSYYQLMKGWRAAQAAKGYENLSCDDQIMFVNRFNKEMTKADIIGLQSLEAASHLVKTFVCSKSWLDAQKVKGELIASAWERWARAKQQGASSRTHLAHR